MKKTLSTILIAGVTLVLAQLLLIASASANTPQMVGELAAELTYHCSDEHTDYSYLSFLKPLVSNYTDEQKAQLSEAIFATKQQLENSNNINLGCDLVLELVK